MTKPARTDSRATRTPVGAGRVAAADLQSELDQTVDALKLLTAVETAELHGMFTRARADQRQALDAAMAEVLGHLPRLIRAPARKILLG